MPTAELTTYSASLEAKLLEASGVLDREGVVLFLFEDMVEISDHFQATLDWFKARGNRMTQRFAQGVYMTKGMVYFVGADTHVVPTRGVDIEIDLRPEAHELIRKTGLEARLRKKGLIE